MEECKLFWNYTRYTEKDLVDTKYISRPRLINCFSIDQDRNYLNSYQNLKYLRLPNEAQYPIAYDLAQGYEIYRPKLPSAYKERLDHLLEFVIHNLHSLKREMDQVVPQDQDTSFLKHKFICFRGLLTKMMCTPYEFSDKFCIHATRYRGTIYLHAFDTKDMELIRNHTTNYCKQVCYYGFKFEQFILSSDPNLICETNRPVYSAEEFCGVFETKLNDKVLLYGAEMDGVKRNQAFDFTKSSKGDILQELRKSKFVEVKVKLKEVNDRLRATFRRFHSRKWWCQSFLVGIEKIYVGRRDDNGIVTEIDEIPTHELPKHGSTYWNPAICMKFCDEFLSFIEEKMKDVDCPKTVYQFQYNPPDQRNMYLSRFIGYNIYSFLPNWYTDIVK